MHGLTTPTKHESNHLPSLSFIHVVLHIKLKTSAGPAPVSSLPLHYVRLFACLFTCLFITASFSLHSRFIRSNHPMRALAGSERNKTIWLERLGGPTGTARTGSPPSPRPVPSWSCSWQFPDPDPTVRESGASRSDHVWVLGRGSGTSTRHKLEADPKSSSRACSRGGDRHRVGAVHGGWRGIAT